MAGARKLDVLTITQARKAFQRAKFILEQRQKAAVAAESSADAALKAKVTQALLEARIIVDLKRNALLLSMIKTQQQLSEAKAEQEHDVQPSTSQAQQRIAVHKVPGNASVPLSAVHSASLKPQDLRHRLIAKEPAVAVTALDLWATLTERKKKDSLRGGIVREKSLVVRAPFTQQEEVSLQREENSGVNLGSGVSQSHSRISSPSRSGPTSRQRHIDRSSCQNQKEREPRSNSQRQRSSRRHSSRDRQQSSRDHHHHSSRCSDAKRPRLELIEAPLALSSPSKEGVKDFGESGPEDEDILNIH